MKKIKNIEEKKRVLCYIIGKSRRGTKYTTLVNNNVFKYWITFWRNDMLYDGIQCCNIHNEQVVKSRKSSKKKEKQPDCCEYYTDVITQATDYINQHFNSNDRRQNEKNARKELINYRSECLSNLDSLIKKNQLDGLYQISANGDITSQDYTKLCEYILHRIQPDGKLFFVTKSDYDTIKNYINNLI